MGGQVADLPTGNLGEHAEPECWETRLPEESPKAFKAFCLFRNMGYKRSIKACLELNDVDPKKYGSWSRYARLFNWKERAAKYDEYVAKEIEKELIAERVERKRRQMEMHNDFDGLVDKRIKTLNPEELDADGAMDLLERSAKHVLLFGGNRSGKTTVLVMALIYRAVAYPGSRHLICRYRAKDARSSVLHF